MNFQSQEFSGYIDRLPDFLLHGAEFTKCVFMGAAFALVTDPALRPVVSNVKLLDCEVRVSSVYKAVIEDCLIENMKMKGNCYLWASALKHVIIRGKIDGFMISSAVRGGVMDEEVQNAFDKANAEYYETVDWALDISEAISRDIDIRGVPARLIRRDSHSQVVVRRANVVDGAWRNVDLSGTYWPCAIEQMLHRGDADVVLVAPKRDRNYHLLLDGLTKLRDAGIAEPD